MKKPLSQILVVEDEPEDLDLTLKILARFSMQTTVLRDGKEAWNYLFGHSHTGGFEFPDLVVLDIGLPHVNGLQILTRMRTVEQTRRIPVIILTRFEDERGFLQSFDFKPWFYVMKPLTIAKLIYALPSLNLQIIESVLYHSSGKDTIASFPFPFQLLNHPA
jgi:CheY-like chemotaxis protein